MSLSSLNQFLHQELFRKKKVDFDCIFIELADKKPEVYLSIWIWHSNILWHWNHGLFKLLIVYLLLFQDLWLFIKVSYQTRVLDHNQNVSHTVLWDVNISLNIITPVLIFLELKVTTKVISTILLRVTCIKLRLAQILTLNFIIIIIAILVIICIEILRL